MMFEFDVSYGLNSVPSNSYVEALIQNMVVYGDRAFSREFRSNEIITMGPQFNRIGGLIRIERKIPSHSLSLLTTPCIIERP